MDMSSKKSVLSSLIGVGITSLMLFLVHRKYAKKSAKTMTTYQKVAIPPNKPKKEEASMYLSQEKVNRLQELTQSIEKSFKLQYAYYSRFIAINALKLNREFDEAVVKNLMSYIKQNTSIFSPFRNQSYILASLLYLHADKPEEVFLRIKDHADALKKAGFKQTAYLPMAAYCLDSILYDKKIQDMAIQTRSYKESLIEKSVATYKEMKKNHPWITSGKDYALSILMAHSNEAMAKVEEVLQSLSRLGLKKNNGLQGLASILALSNEEVNVLCERTLILKEKLTTHGIKVNDSMYPGLGLLIHLDHNEDYLKAVVEVIAQLRKLKKFKLCDRSLLFLFAILLVSEGVKQDVSSKTIYETAISITIEQIITAQIAVMIALLASSSAMTASS
jgi:hypothetical protein